MSSSNVPISYLSTQIMSTLSSFHGRLVTGGERVMVLVIWALSRLAWARSKRPLSYFRRPKPMANRLATPELSTLPLAPLSSSQSRHRPTVTRDTKYPFTRCARRDIDIFLAQCKAFISGYLQYQMGKRNFHPSQWHNPYDIIALYLSDTEPPKFLVDNLVENKLIFFVHQICIGILR